MTRTRLLASLGLSLLLSPLAAAQSVSSFSGEEHTAAWPDDLKGTGAFGRGVPGLFTQALTPDAVLLQGTTPVLLARPAESFATLTFPVQANDLAVLPAGAPGGLDAVVFVGPAGATLGWFDAATGSVATSLLCAAPSDAQLVRVGDFDANGALDFIVLEADGVTVTPYLANGVGGFAAGTSVVASAPCQSLVVVRWDADAASEFALLTELGVELFDDDSAPRASWPAALPGGALCAFSEAGASVDRLLWITAYAPPAQQFMMTLSPAGVDDLVNLGALDAFAVVATDYDLDGFEDVLVSHKYSHELLWFQNQRSATNPLGASFTSDSTGMRTFSVGPSTSGAPENEAWPIVADFDGDGDDDIVFPTELTQELAVLRGESIDQAGMFATAGAGSLELDPLTQTAVLHLDLDRPALLPTAASALEIEVWRRPDLAAPMDAQATEHLIVPLPAAWPLDAEIPLPENATEFSTCYYVQVRLVEQDAQGSVIRSFPTSVLAVASTQGTDALLALTDEVSGTETIALPDGEANQGQGRMVDLLPRPPAGELPTSAVVMF